VASSIRVYKLSIKPSAGKEIERLSTPLIARIVKEIEDLAVTPRPPGCRKLKGGDGEWRVRVGDYRIIYKIYDQESLVEVTKVKHRSSVYD
jgi:mRNA interferase RelE/StbE